jgi:hypothetical protein
MHRSVKLNDYRSVVNLEGIAHAAKSQRAGTVDAQRQQEQLTVLAVTVDLWKIPRQTFWADK